MLLGTFICSVMLGEKHSLISGDKAVGMRAKACELGAEGTTL